MSDYHAPRGAEATPKPLAVYRDKLRNGVDPVDARLDFYLEVQFRWWRLRGRPDLFRRHFHQIRDIAHREAA